jgi:hypothetical protein
MTTNGSKLKLGALVQSFAGVSKDAVLPSFDYSGSEVKHDGLDYNA